MRYRRFVGVKSSVDTWRAAAKGAHVDGDHAAELRYRNTARRIKRLPELAAGVRCIDGTKP